MDKASGKLEKMMAEFGVDAEGHIECVFYH